MSGYLSYQGSGRSVDRSESYHERRYDGNGRSFRGRGGYRGRRHEHYRGRGNYRGRDYRDYLDGRDIRERDMRERDPRDRDPRNRDSRDRDPREFRDRDPREFRERDPREFRERDPREFRERDPRERDPRERDPRERDPRERDPRERDPRERDPREPREYERDRENDFRPRDDQELRLDRERAEYPDRLDHDRQDRNDRDRERERPRPFRGGYRGSHGFRNGSPQSLTSGGSTPSKKPAAPKNTNPWLSILHIGEGKTAARMEANYKELQTVNKTIAELQAESHHIACLLATLEVYGARDALNVEITTEKLDEFMYL